ncbi:MAG TPA: hypothetical protein VM821_03075 [Abditibacteriaceae bacterium]|nr:hypothetical protein [Abditibacteriaceae bacterium]
MEIRISTATQEVVEDVATYDHTFSDLVSALHLTMSESGSFDSVWPLEPDYLGLTFERDLEGCGLRINSSKPLALVYYGSYQEVCLPFWRALKGLCSRYLPEELEERIGDTFSFSHMNQLSAAVQAMEK